MKKIVLFFLLFLIVFNYSKSNQDSIDIINRYKPIAEKIINAAIKDSSAWYRLAYMTDVFGPRLSGSKNLEKALDWMIEEMKKDNFSNVREEKVMVPHWVRGEEYAELIYPRKANIPIFTLGGSISTPEEGIEGEVIVVNDVKELEILGKEKIQGKILVFNQPFKNYGQSVQYRFYGAQWAAKYGAVASLIRSVSPNVSRNLHTGMMAYVDSIPKIPHAAITPEDAMMLQRLISYGITPKIKIKITSKFLDDAVSRNIMGEIKGTNYPEQIIALGGHSDSWDAGTGAQDNASGCISTWMAAKLIKDLNLNPKRTIRVVQWVNEENGVRGGYHYRDHHSDEEHVLMFEHDSGVFPPSAIRITANDTILKILKYTEPLFQLINSEMKVTNGGGGVDIAPMMKAGVPGMSLSTNDSGKYFYYHHSHSDTADKVDPKDLNHCIAAIALAIYIYSDLELELPSNFKGHNDTNRTR